jgi:hypothetical protein
MKSKIISLFFVFSFLFASVVHASDSYDHLESHQPYFVGELGASWQFPSDHLPRGATIENFHIAFWNILNKNYLGHIEENTQGLRYSSILKDNVPVETGNTLTLREVISGEIILEMINHPTHPRSLIALQETHPDVHKYLKQNLPTSWMIAAPPNQPNSQDIFLYDGDVFELINLEAVQYSPKFPKMIFTITLREKPSNKVFRFLQSHIPGGPINSADGCAKFSEEALKQFDPSLTMVLMGDMNQSPRIIQEALEMTTQLNGRSQPFTYLPITHPSHMNTKLEASWIDNFFIYNPDTNIQASDLPEEVCNGLVPIVQLLNDLKGKE